MVARLSQRDLKLVLVESCTCGRVAAELGLVAGVSQFLCGSLVVYRATSKRAWLGIDQQIIDQYSTESPQCSQALVEAALVKTAEADVAISVTGDLGPGVAADRDGWIHIAGQMRSDGRQMAVSTRLTTENRAERQLEAAQAVLRSILQLIG